MQDLDRGVNIFFALTRNVMYWAVKVVTYLRGTKAFFFIKKYDALWYILNCFLVKFQGKNRLKISMFIANTKKAANLW